MRKLLKNKLITIEVKRTLEMVKLIKECLLILTPKIEDPEPEEEKKYPNKEPEDTTTEPTEMT
jgi:hypothetical protein